LLDRARPAPATGWKVDAERGNRHQRGYGYEWEKLRVVILRRDHGLCQCPECQGGRLRLTVADQVHHIVGKAEARARGWTPDEIDHPSNLQAINRDCHARITAKQAHGG
jgi:5-methylcytosine-specific restriction protein A